MLYLCQTVIRSLFIAFKVLLTNTKAFKIYERRFSINDSHENSGKKDILVYFLDERKAEISYFNNYAFSNSSQDRMTFDASESCLFCFMM